MGKHDTIDFMGKMWLWPRYDKHLRLILDHVLDLDLALKHCVERRTAVQAGGAMGVWPWYLSQHFASVWSFEAASDNYFYLNHNTNDRANINPVRGALGKQDGWAYMKRHSSEADNVGAYYTVPSKDRAGCRVHALDSIIPPGSFVDLLQLDVEGREHDVLCGAERILLEDKPVVMIESKPLPQDSEIGNHPDDALELLQALGYEVVERAHRDLVLVHREKAE